MARGGMRPTAPQNNPMNVSARGGNGQSGDATQAAKYVPGLPYGEGQALMETQGAAPLAAASSIEQSGMPSGLASAAASQPLIPLNAPSMRPNEPITSGIDMGPGPDSSILGYGKQEYADRQKFASQMEEYRPALMFMASQPNTSPETRNLIRRLFV
jgi:hypothetical protein